MSNLQNEALTEAKFEVYKAYIQNLSREFLLNEFNDHIGCDPKDFYSNANKQDNMEAWIDTLLDAYAYTLYVSPETQWSTSIK